MCILNHTIKSFKHYKTLFNILLHFRPLCATKVVYVAKKTKMSSN